MPACSIVAVPEPPLLILSAGLATHALQEHEQTLRQTATCGQQRDSMPFKVWKAFCGVSLQLYWLVDGDHLCKRSNRASNLSASGVRPALWSFKMACNMPSLFWVQSVNRV